MKVSVELTPREINVIGFALCVLSGKYKDAAKGELRDGKKFSAFLDYNYSEEACGIYLKLPEVRESGDDMKTRSSKLNKDFESFGDIILSVIESSD